MHTTGLHRRRSSALHAQQNIIQQIHTGVHSYVCTKCIANNKYIVQAQLWHNCKWAWSACGAENESNGDCTYVHSHHKQNRKCPDTCKICQRSASPKPGDRFRWQKGRRNCYTNAGGPTQCPCMSKCRTGYKHTQAVKKRPKRQKHKYNNACKICNKASKQAT